MRKLEELESWIKSEFKNQTGLATKLGLGPSRVSKWVNQDETMAEEWQEKLKAMGYTGPWPKDHPALISGSAHGQAAATGRLEARPQGIAEAAISYRESSYQGPEIWPDDIGLAYDLLDAVLGLMPPEKVPSLHSRSKAVVLLSRLAALDRAEGAEGNARRFALGLKAEWMGEQVGAEAAPQSPSDS